MSNSENTTAATSTTALLICPNQSMLSELVPVLTHSLAGVQIQPVKEYPDADSLSRMISDHRARLCFLDVTSDAERSLELIHEAQILEPALQIVVLLTGNTPELILRCLRQGAAEFLMRPFSAEDLKPVLVRLSQLSPVISCGKGGKIICVTPAKGACGASTIAANLAFRSKRKGVDRVLLADLDPLTGTISFLLKLSSNYSFLDAMNLSASLDSDLWRGVVSTVNGVDVVLAPENPMDTMSETQDPTAVLEFARQLYDTIIVDTYGAYGEWGLALARLADELLLVTTNELPALQATQKILSHFDRNRIERSKVRLVVNRYSREVGLSRDAIATALHTDVFQIIPSDYDAVQRALVDGKPISTTSSFGKSLQGLARNLAGETQQPPPKAKKARSASLTGLFSSIFSKATP